MSNEAAKTTQKALYTAITELILYLKGDGTMSSLQNMTGIHRNVLSEIFKVYNGQKTGKKVLTKSEHPKEKRLYWEMDSIITIATKLDIPVSELMRAAEDSCEKMPLWFRLRISCGTDRRSIAELGNIFLEALGCFSYADPFQVAGAIQNMRQYHRKGSSNTPASSYITESYSEGECGELKRIATQLLENGDLSEFARAYQSEKITSKDAYVVMKTAVDRVKEKRGFEGKIEPEQLYEDRSDFVKAIRESWSKKVFKKK